MKSSPAGAEFPLVPGEAWTDAALDDLQTLDLSRQSHWRVLLELAATAKTARPTGAWRKRAQALMEPLGAAEVGPALECWLPLVSGGRTRRLVGDTWRHARGAEGLFDEQNADTLRGLLWIASLLPPSPALLRGIASVALTAYRKLPRIGPRSIKVGNAAVFALSEFRSLESVAQLAIIKTRVKLAAAQKGIAAALEQAAAALGLSRDDIEELAVPTYGFDTSGQRTEVLDDYRCEIAIAGPQVEQRWFAPDGKRLKAAPAKVKRDHPEECLELKQAVRDIQAMLTTQRDRLDALFLLDRRWPIVTWRERYLEHPLIGSLARRLIWCVDDTPALFVDCRPSDLQGEPIAHGRTAEVRIWHPVSRPIEEVLAWRRRLEELQITQPFKQAHREVYLLTDAERRTRTYSNRFAAHILRQHQFHALCAARGWQDHLRLLVDGYFPPARKDLLQWGLRAEFWVEGIGDNWQTDLTESGSFLRVATDQVRFYAVAAAPNFAHASGGGYVSAAMRPTRLEESAPLPLDQIPPLVFSEIMRDVDLFVGVASVGNDPTWHDGGPAGRFRDYWQQYSFGDLSGSATTRKEALQRLIPRLQIGDRCSFSDRFLNVRGDRRKYKIHLGSGNILMEPNDQYLCIVPDAKARAGEESLYLPFEGDQMLSIILSKAILLANDRQIKDPTINQQIDWQ